MLADQHGLPASHLSFTHTNTYISPRMHSIASRLFGPQHSFTPHLPLSFCDNHRSPCPYPIASRTSTYLRSSLLSLPPRPYPPFFPKASGSPACNCKGGFIHFVSCWLPACRMPIPTPCLLAYLPACVCLSPLTQISTTHRPENNNPNQNKPQPTKLNRTPSNSTCLCNPDRCQCPATPPLSPPASPSVPRSVSSLLHSQHARAIVTTAAVYMGVGALGRGWEA